MIEYAKVAIHATRYHILLNGKPMCARPIRNEIVFNETKTHVRPNKYNICTYCQKTIRTSVALPQMTRELYDALYDWIDMRDNGEIERMKEFDKSRVGRALAKAATRAGVVGQRIPNADENIPF